MVQTDTSHFSHAGAAGIKALLLEQIAQHLGNLVLLLVAQREVEDAIAGVAEPAVPKTVIDGNESGFGYSQKNRRNPLVGDAFTWAQLLQALTLAHRRMGGKTICTSSCSSRMSWLIGGAGPLALLETRSQLLQGVRDLVL